RDVEPGDLDVAIGEIANDLRAAVLERDMKKLEAGALGQDLGVDLLIAANTGAAIAHLAGPLLGILEELGEGLGREVRRGREEEHWRFREPCDDLHYVVVIHL